MRRIYGMRAEPRVISIAGVREVDDGSIDVDIIDDGIPDEVVLNDPEVVNSVLMRAEMIDDRKPVGHTTVHKVIDAQEAIRMIPPSIAESTRTTTLRGGVRENLRPTMKTINRNPSSIDDPADLAVLSKELNGDGLIVESGRSIIAKLHQNDSREFTLSYRGSQAMRIVAYDDAGRPLLDIDVLPSEKQNTLHLPVQSDYLAVTGYGGNEGMFDTENQDSGSLSLNYSTDDTAGVGFHPRTRLVSSPIGYLCRGGLVTLSRTGLSEKQWIHAVDALKSTKVASFYTSSNITTFAIVHAHEDIPSIETQGLEIVSDAYLIQGNALSISIWPVRRSTESSVCKISTSFNESGSLHSMIGLVGHHGEWIEFFKSRDWTTIIEEGAICGRGESVVLLSSSNDSIKLKSAEELSPVLKEMKKAEVKGPRFDLGSIMVGEKLVQSIAKFAADDEQDALVFKMLSGPENAALSPDGELVYSPGNEEVGFFEIVVQVSDKGGIGGNAIFFGMVVGENTRPYWVGGE